MAVSGVGLTLATGGGILLWSGLSGVTPLVLVKSLAGGQPAPPVTVGSMSQLIAGFVSQLGSAIASALGSAASSAAGGLLGGGGSSGGGSGVGPLLNGLGQDLIMADQGTGVPSALNARIASAAVSHVGVPYSWGGASPDGWDCSGFVTYVLHHDIGLNLPDNGHTVSQVLMVWSGATTIPSSQCQAGDLVCWLTHVAIATGPTTCVGAENARVGTVQGPITSMGPGGETYLIRRVKPQSALAVA